MSLYWTASEGSSVQSVIRKRVAQNTCVTLMLQDSLSTPISNRVQGRRRLWAALPLSFLSHSLRRGWRKGSMPWMVLLPLLTTLIIIFHPATRHSMNSQYQTNRQEMKEQMLSPIPGVSFIYREPIQTTRDRLCSLLGIIETFFFSIWRLMDSLFGLTMLVHNDEVICLILWL